MSEKIKIVDYGADVAPPPGDNVLARIDFLANAQLDAEADVDAAEEGLKRAKERLRDLKERQLPEAMSEARQKALTTITNVKVKLVEKVRASIPEAKRAEGFALIREKGNGAIIKTSLEVPFEAGRDPAARGLQALILFLSHVTYEEIFEALMNGARRLLPAEKWDELECAKAFLRSISNEGEARVQLSSTIHPQTLAAYIRELLSKGEVSPEEMSKLGAHAWTEAEVKRKD